MRAVIYIRVSTEEQLEGHSLDAQRTTTRALLTDRHWDFAGEYLDAGISAKSDSYRPALAQLLEDAGRGRFDVVVVDKIDRFYRHLKGLLMALDTLQECNVTFVSVQEKIDLSTPWGKLTMTVLGMLAEIYIDNLRYETRKGKMARARKGLWNGTPKASPSATAPGSARPAPTATARTTARSTAGPTAGTVASW